MAEVHAACLAGYLDQLRHEGSLDSKGVFTLSGERAEEQLARFRLPDSRLYVLNAVAAAVALGSQQVEIDCDSDDFILTARGLDLGGRALNDLLAGILSENQPQGLRELGLAYFGAQALKPQRICLQTRQQRLEWPGDKLVSQPGEADLRLHVHERLGLRTAQKFLARVTGQTRLDSEEDALKRHCNLVPIPVTLNGQPLSRPIVLSQVRTRLLRPASLPSHHPLGGLSVPFQEAPWPALICDGGRLAPFIILVVNGVNFRLSPKALGGAEVRAIVYVDHLRKDLAQVHLVQDEHFQEVLEELRRAWVS